MPGVKPAIYFCTNTSLRGVRRIVFGETLYLRLFWLVFVSVCAVLLGVNVFYNMKLYFSGPTVIMSHIKPLNTEPFPGISFCFMNSFSKEGYEAFRRGDVMSPYNYSRKVRRAILNVSTLIYALPYDSYSGYFQNIGTEVLKNITHSKTHIFLCILFVRMGGQVIPYETSCAFKVTQFFHSSYYSCYRLIAPKDFSHMIDSAVIAIKDTRPGREDFEKYSAHGMPYENLYPATSTGIRAIIHDANSYPDMAKGTCIQSGTATTIEFDTYLVNRLAGRCYGENKLPGEVIGFECGGEKFSKRVMEACNCIPIRDTILLDPIDPTQFCMNLNFKNITESLAKLQCLVKQMVKVEPTQCPLPCRELNYEFRITTSHIDDSDPRNCVIKKLAQYMEVNKNTKNANIVSGIIQIVTEFKTASCTPDVAKATHMDDWVLLQILSGHSYITEHNEINIYTLSNLLSSIGGAGSLFLGLTVTLLAEIIEILILTISKKTRIDSCRMVKVSTKRNDNVQEFDELNQTSTT